MSVFADSDLILVAIMPNVRDFEIARLLGWYRIPLRMAPKIIDVDYLAFYQTNSFGSTHRWKIEYFAPVLGHELTTRAELLRDESTHPRAKEEYYKIQIGPVTELNPAVPAGNWKRITFLYTLGSLFNQAHIINDLVVKSEDHEMLWKCLRERKQSYQSVEDQHQLKLFTDEELIKLLGQMTDPALSRIYKDI